ncbi:MAG TPA: hypothetical protein VGI06_18165, partial [Acidimicrobiales bacterium]
MAAAALVLGVAGSGGLGAAAWAAGAPRTASPLGPTVVTFTTPAASGQSLTQRPVVLNGDVSRPGGFVDSISVTVAWTDQVANRVPGPHPTESFTDNPDVREADVPWDVSPGVAFNGHYTVTVVGTTDGGNGTPQEQTSAAEPFIVDVSPATPANVVITTDAGPRITHLKWTPNTEPDLLGYDVVRGGPTTTPSRVIATVPAPQASYTDDQVAT